MERVRKKLEALREGVEKGALKAPEKIGAALARMLGQKHGCRYFDGKLRKGEFRYFEPPVILPREKAMEGKYVIQTEEQDWSAVEAVQAYQDLHEVERGFAHLKGLLEVRPVYHRGVSRNLKCNPGGIVAQF